MAHWIIEDHVFGGSYYKCSKCGYLFWDIYMKEDYDEYCPGCKEEIDVDENEYVEKRHDVGSTYHTQFMAIVNARIASKHRYVEIEEKVSRLKQVSGYSIDKLIELFAAGYELRSPEYKVMNDILSDII